MSLAVIGASSEIAEATARLFFEDHHSLLLVARDIGKISNHFQMKDKAGQAIEKYTCNFRNPNDLHATSQRIIASFDDDPYILVAVGSIEGQDIAKNDPEAAANLIDINFRNLVVLLTPIVNALESRGNGCLIIISSVAGDRGRQSNYVYGAAKAGLTTFAQGLRNRLSPAGVHVLTVIPGYVDTRMLRGAMGQEYSTTPRILIGNVETVARRIHRAAVTRKNVIYVDPIWRVIMWMICAIPESLFKGLKF